MNRAERRRQERAEAKGEWKPFVQQDHQQFDPFKSFVDHISTCQKCGAQRVCNWVTEFLGKYPQVINSILRETSTEKALHGVPEETQEDTPQPE